MHKHRKDLATSREHEVVKFFGESLKYFVTALGGCYESNEVTRREERKYPSDQDYAVLLPAGGLIPAEGEFSLHLFALQFKRWEDNMWDITVRQNDTLRPMSQVIAYALPRPEKTPRENGLHSFVFVNPSFLPAKTNSLRLQTYGYNLEVAAAKTNRAGERWVIPHMSWGELFHAILRSAIRVTLRRGEPPHRDGGGGGGDGPSGMGLCYVGDGPWHSEYIQQQLIEHLEFWCDNFLEGNAGLIAYESFSEALTFLELDVG